jgi:hypothetical protein
MRHRDAVDETIERLARRLAEEKIPYALIGAMAMAMHGEWRFTQDVDVLTTREGLDAIHERLVGRGYMPSFPGSRKSLRDTTSKVAIDFIMAGEYPGDSLAKPVSFPDPDAASVDIDGVRVISLAKLIELKLTSGLTGKGRKKDIVDVETIIARIKPPRELGDQLDPSIRDTFYQMWDDEQNATGPDRE